MARSCTASRTSPSDKSADYARSISNRTVPKAYAPALDAIVNADLIILGPGSLYTSVIPNLLVSGVVDAIRWSRGTTVYACNVATQTGETDHFTATDHIRAVVEYLGRGNLDYAVVNSNRASAEAIRPELGVQAVLDDGQIAIYDGVKIVGADVISDVNPLAARSHQALAGAGRSRAARGRGSSAYRLTGSSHELPSRSKSRIAGAGVASLTRLDPHWESTGSEAWHYGWQSMGWGGSPPSSSESSIRAAFPIFSKSRQFTTQPVRRASSRALRNDCGLWSVSRRDVARRRNAEDRRAGNRAFCDRPRQERRPGANPNIPLVIVDGTVARDASALDQHLKKGAKKVILPAASSLANINLGIGINEASYDPEAARRSWRRRQERQARLPSCTNYSMVLAKVRVWQRHRAAPASGARGLLDSPAAAEAERRALARLRTTLAVHLRTADRQAEQSSQRN